MPDSPILSTTIAMNPYTPSAIEAQLQEKRDTFAERGKTDGSDLDAWYDECEAKLKKAGTRIQQLNTLVEKIGKYPWHANDVKHAKDTLLSIKTAIFTVARAIMDTGVSAFVKHDDDHDFMLHWTSLELDYRANAQRRIAMAEQCQWLDNMASEILTCLDRLKTYTYVPPPCSDDSSVLDAALEATCDTIKRNAAAEPPAKRALK
jgi:hypothetical protein